MDCARFIRMVRAVGVGLIALSAPLGWTLELRQAAGVFLDRASTPIDKNLLRFAESRWRRGRDIGFVFALRRRSDHFYLWIRTRGASAGKNLFCDGRLRGADQRPVMIDDISSFDLFDPSASGSTFLAAKTHEGVLRVWNLDNCATKAEFDAIATEKLGAAGASEIVGGDFANAGRDQIMILDRRDGAYSLWQLAGGSLVQSAKGTLRERPNSTRALHNISYLVTTRVPAGAANLAGASALIVLNDQGASLTGTKGAEAFAPDCSNPTACIGRTLIFNIDQGFSGGLQDLASRAPREADKVLDRVIAALDSLHSRYKVWVLLNPIQHDRAATLHVLDRLVAAKIPFLLDLYSSDVVALAHTKRNWLDYAARAVDPAAGISVALDAPSDSPDSLNFYARRYGTSFAGVRFMERLGMDIQARLPDAAQLIPFNDPDHAKLLFDWDFARRIADWAEREGKTILWSDNAIYIPYSCYWSEQDIALATHARDDYVRRENDLVRRYPSIVPVYANNEGVKRCGVVGRSSALTPRNFRLPTWQDLLQRITTQPGAFGLSVQSWTSDNDPLLDNATLPVDEMIVWTYFAFARGALYVEYEPFSYFFNARPPSSSQLPALAVTLGGSPNANFARLYEALMGGNSAFNGAGIPRQAP